MRARKKQPERIGGRIKLRDLRIVSAVAQSGSMVKAADQLAVSQPVISKAVSDLEHWLGVRLFERTAHGVEPTNYGRALVKCGVAVFDDIRRGVAELEYLADPGQGEIRIGNTPPLGTAFVPSVIDRLSRQYPRIRLHVVQDDFATLLNRDLRQRLVDLAVAWLPGPQADDDTNVEILFHDQHVFVAGAQSKWARRRKIALSDIMEEPWVLPPPDSMVGMSIAEAFRAAGTVPPNASVLSFSIPLHHYLLATGRFVTMLPVSMYHFGARHLPLKLLPIASPVPPRPVGIVTLKERTLSPAANLFVECARAQAKSMKDGAGL
jgi:DNA-binding transcriptional LysR family regulator